MILIQQSKVPDRHSPRKSKSHLPSRKGCARCAGVDRGVHICMHDARLEALRVRMLHVPCASDM